MKVSIGLEQKQSPDFLKIIFIIVNTKLGLKIVYTPPRKYNLFVKKLHILISI